MIRYVLDHWRGRQTLARSFWINGVLLLALMLATAELAGRTFPAERAATAAWRGLGVFVAIAVVGVWQAVGIWRSAVAATPVVGRNRWAVAVKGVVLGMAVAAMLQHGAIALDRIATLNALDRFERAEFRIEQRGGTGIALIGVLSERSADAAIAAMAPPVATLGITSRGGVIEAAVRLGQAVQAGGITVIAEGECQSACLFVLGAAPRAAMTPGTIITFHQVVPLVEFTSALLRRRHERYVERVAGYYRTMSIPDEAIERIARELTWTPTIRELIELRLIDGIIDPADGSFVPAEAYCAERAEECGK